MIEGKNKSELKPPPLASSETAVPKSMPSPSLSRQDILRSLVTKSPGPVQGKPIVGKGGYKPFRPPPEGTKVMPVKIGPKLLRPPSAWSKR